MSTINPDELCVAPGRAFPLGATVRPSGVRFAVCSRHATAVWLALFNERDDRESAFEVQFDPQKNRIGDVWSIFVQGLGPGTLYAYRVDGPWDPEDGHRFDPDLFLLDPYSRAIVGDREKNLLKCVVMTEDFDWVDDIRPGRPMTQTIVYETHVRGLTAHPSSRVESPGTYQGITEKIPYLKDLGVTAVELLPVQEPGKEELPRTNPMTGERLTDYWGYDVIGFFAPAGRYGTQGGTGEQYEEFRAIVSALHKAGIEVILDVVFNHTAEGNEKGPTLSFRGIDNAVYYLLDGSGNYLNFSGCGNTVNCNHPLVRDMILDCLRYWVTVMHVDGFRFDLASILGRDCDGEMLENPPLIERIVEDPVLRDVKLIAEAWDAAGAYQVGSFGSGRWAEWNGRYRDDVRRFWFGDASLKRDFAARLAGSPDIYESGGRTPAHSINFVTAHDGFTLRDLVSYDEKHNEANGENNQDGWPLNYSWNCGAEGPTDDPAINALRLRMQKNFLATLFLSMGVPMLLGGDEFGRSQKGNNNAYCQDNEISWYDWSLRETNRELLRFCKAVMRFRREQAVFRRGTYLNGTPNGDEAAEASWHEPAGDAQTWSDDAPTLAWRIAPAANGGTPLYLAFNACADPVEFTLPQGAWRMFIDTSAEAPDDICESTEDAPPVSADVVTVGARSMVVFASDGVGR